ncbi:MAG TPA: hypothetical protein DCF63_12120, partial [Planctomycetaceae bacterium]|nr:hypothetical protein [Planctomycetaceae bacterium]
VVWSVAGARRQLWQAIQTSGWQAAHRRQASRGGASQAIQAKQPDSRAAIRRVIKRSLQLYEWL